MVCNDTEELSLDLTAISHFANACFCEEYVQTKCESYKCKDNSMRQIVLGM